MRFGIGFNQRNLLAAAPGEAHILQRHTVDWEEATGRAVFWRHVSNGGPVCQRQGVQPVTIEFNEFAHYPVLTQHLGNSEHQIGGGNAFTQFTGQLKADYVRDQHGNRLTEHGGLGFDTPYPPAQYAKAVDHGGVRVGADQRIRVGHPLFILQFAPHRFAKVFEIDLVADTGAGRDNAKAAEGLLAPLQKHVTLVVTLHLQAHVLFKRFIIAKVVHGDRVVDDKVHRRKRVHFGSIAAKTFNRFTHRGQIDHCRNASKVLHQDPGRTIGYLPVGMGILQPPGERVNILRGDRDVILPAQEVFQ